jgi:F0F1-type ATP synthase membrane subunit a
MIKKINKNILFAFVLLANGMIYAQPTDEDGVEGEDTVVSADINHLLIFLLLVSIFYAFYSIRKKKLNNN